MRCLLKLPGRLSLRKGPAGPGRSNLVARGQPSRTSVFAVLLFASALLLTACATPPSGWPGIAVTDGRVYVLSPGHKLLALNLDERSRATLFPAEGEWQFPKDEKKLGGTYSAPVLAGGTLYVTTYQAGGLFGILYAIDPATGDVRWKFEPGGTANSMVGSPTVADETLYIGSDDHKVYALDASTGAKKWEYQTKNKVWAGIRAEGESVFVASLDHHLYALNRGTGELQWQFKTGGPLASMPAYDRGTLYLGSGDGSLYAFDAASGQQRWQSEAGSWLWGTPLLQDGVLYAGSLAKQVHAIDAATGTRKWSFDTFGPVSATPVLAQGLLLVADQSGRVYALDASTGSKRWEYLTDPQGAIHSALTADGGKVYLMSMNRKLVALNIADGRAEWTCPTGGEQVCR